MSDHHVYLFPTATPDRDSQRSANTRHPPHYPVPSNACQEVLASAYPLRANAAHDMALAHPSTREDRTVSSTSSQLMSPNIHHQLGNSDVPPLQARPAGRHRAPYDVLLAIPEAFNTSVRYLPKFTLYEMICASRDFEDVKVALNERTNWSIELFRSCFTIRLAHGGYVFMLSLLFLVMAENMHLHYGRLSPAKLKERVDAMGHMTFAILFATLDLGVIVVRIAGIFALSEKPVLATSLVLTSMMPWVVTHFITTFRSRRGRISRDGAEVESSDVVREGEV